MSRNKTLSRWFFDDQILFVELDEQGRKVIHLKMGVRKQFNSGYLDYNECYQRNKELDIYDMHKKVKMKLYGEGDFSESYD